MPNIFSMNESLISLPPVVGFEIMRLVGNSRYRRMSLFEIFDRVKDRPWFAPKVVYYSLAFLFVTGIIEFDGLYVSAVRNDKA